MPDAKTYRAFISYNHAADAATAAALASSLTRFARPWYQRRAMRVFLDKNSMSADPTLWGAIEHALAQAEWLILLACPASAASPWVQRELAWWRAHRPVSRLIIVRTGGEIVWDKTVGTDFDWVASTALSPALKSLYRDEPLWVDFMAAAAAPRKTVADPVFRDAFLTIAAPIHGVSKDALWSAEGAEQRKRVAAAGVASALVAVFAWGTYNQWQVSMDRKENLASIQLGAKAFLALPASPQLAAQIALAGVALRPSGIAASALRSAAAMLAPASAPVFERFVPGAVGIAFSPDGERLAVLAGDGDTTIFDAVRGDVLARLTPSRPFTATAIAWGAGAAIAIGAADGLHLWRLGEPGPATAPTEWPLRPLPAVRALAFAAAGKHLALAHADGSVSIVDARSGDTTQRFAAHAGAANAVAFSADGTRLATGGEDANGGEAVLWSLATGRRVLTLRLPQAVVSVDFNLKGGSTLAEHMLAVADRVGTVQVVDAGIALAAGSALSSSPSPSPSPSPSSSSSSSPSPALSSPSAAGIELPLQRPAVAARFVASGRCLALAAAQGPVAVHSMLGFERLFEFGAAAEGQPPVIAMALGQTRRFAVLDAAGRIAVHDQPLCGDAEAVCGVAAERVVSMTVQDRLRWIPADVDVAAPAQQAPGPQCRKLIARVFARAPGATR